MGVLISSRRAGQCAPRQQREGPTALLHILRCMRVLGAHAGLPDTLELSWLAEPEGRDARVASLGGSQVAQRLWPIRSDADFRTLWDHPGLAALEAAAEAAART